MTNGTKPGTDLYDGIHSLWQAIAHDYEQGTLEADTSDLCELLVLHEFPSLRLGLTSKFVSTLAEKMKSRDAPR